MHDERTRQRLNEEAEAREKAEDQEQDQEQLTLALLGMSHVKLLKEVQAQEKFNKIVIKVCEELARRLEALEDGLFQRLGKPDYLPGTGENN